MLAIVHIDWAARHARRVLRPAPGAQRACRHQPGLHAGVPAARRGRRDRAVELPGVHPDGLDRLRAGGRATRWCSSPASSPRRSAAGWSARSPRSGSASSRCCRWSPGSGETGGGAGPQRGRQDRVHRLGGHRAQGDGGRARRTSPRWWPSAAARTRMLVAADADLDAAADAAAWGAMSNAGQTCIGDRAGLRGRRGVPHVPGEADRAGVAGCGPATTGRPTTGR